MKLREGEAHEKLEWNPEKDSEPKRTKKNQET